MQAVTMPMFTAIGRKEQDLENKDHAQGQTMTWCRRDGKQAERGSRRKGEQVTKMHM